MTAGKSSFGALLLAASLAIGCAGGEKMATEDPGDPADPGAGGMSGGDAPFDPGQLDSLPTELEEGSPLGGISGIAATELHFVLFDVPAGATLTIEMMGSGDADLYTKLGDKPTTANYDKRSRTMGTSNETISFVTSSSGDWFIMARGYAAFDNVTITAYVTQPSGGGGTTDCSNVTSTCTAGEVGQHACRSGDIDECQHSIYNGCDRWRWTEVTECGTPSCTPGQTTCNSTGGGGSGGTGGAGGGTVTCSVANPCQANEVGHRVCEQNLAGRSGNDIYECQLLEGCYLWKQIDPLCTTDQVCTESGTNAACMAGGTTCALGTCSGSVKRCFDDGADGKVQQCQSGCWVQIDDCTSGEHCDSATSHCVPDAPTCSNDSGCVLAGQARCSYGQKDYCRTGSDGCLHWNEEQYCADWTMNLSCSGATNCNSSTSCASYSEVASSARPCCSGLRVKSTICFVDDGHAAGFDAACYSSHRDSAGKCAPAGPAPCSTSGCTTQNAMRCGAQSNNPERCVLQSSCLRWVQEHVCNTGSCSMVGSFAQCPNDTCPYSGYERCQPGGTGHAERCGLNFSGNLVYSDIGLRVGC